MAAADGGRRRTWVAIAVVMIITALAAWVLVPHRWEGPVLFGITSTHGIHEGDLLGVAVAAVALGALAFWTARHHPPATPSE